MKFMILLLGGIGFVLGLVSCSDYDAESSPTDAGIRPDFPMVSCIIPLAAGSEWTYRSNEFDENGRPETPSRVANLKLSVSAAFGLREDSSIVEFGDKSDSANDSFIDTLFVYRYETNRNATASLLGYWNKGNHPEIDTPGVYVVGTYYVESDSIALLSKPYLWLAYPAEVGAKWRLPVGNDDSDFVSTELLSKNEPFFTMVAPSQGVLPGDTIHCFLYKEKTVADTVWYRYFAPEYGEVGALMFLNGVRRKAYTLKHYWRGGSI